MRIGDERVHLVWTGHVVAFAIDSRPWPSCDLFSQHAVPVAETEHDPVGRVERDAHQTVAMAVDERLPLLEREPGLREDTRERRMSVASFSRAEI